MPDELSTSKRDLIARVATLELLVADLIHALWRVDPVGMRKLATKPTTTWKSSTPASPCLWARTSASGSMPCWRPDVGC